MSADAFLAAYRGRFVNMLRWEQLSALWAAVRESAESGWYAYQVGEPAPAAPLTPAALDAFLRELDDLLRREHEQRYCGIVYADDPQQPRFIKIYDPNNLGSVCGTGAAPTYPGWILSRLPPVDLAQALPPPGNRRRWWQRLFGA